MVFALLNYEIEIITYKAKSRESIRFFFFFSNSFEIRWHLITAEILTLLSPSFFGVCPSLTNKLHGSQWINLLICPVVTLEVVK